MDERMVREGTSRGMGAQHPDKTRGATGLDFSLGEQETASGTWLYGVLGARRRTASCGDGRCSAGEGSGVVQLGANGTEAA